MSEYYVEPEYSGSRDDGIEFFATHLNSAVCMVKPHIHTAVEILFIQKGKFRVFADDEEYLLSEGDAILFRSHTIHKVYSTYSAKDNYYYCLKIKPSLILEFSSHEHGTSYLLRLSLSDKAEKTVWRKSECDKSGISSALSSLIAEEEKPSYGSDISMKISSASIILSMLRDIENSHSTDIIPKSSDENLTRRIYNAIVYINSHYSEDLTAEECGKLQYMSYSYFSRSFKRITGKSFKDYLNMTRINHAEKSLLTTSKSITEISSECGFNNVSYFISMYKKLKGVTPSAFRESVHQ